jgi:hypothetical protein
VHLVRSSLRHYRGIHALVVAGVAVAVAVLAGALLVGASVRAALVLMPVLLQEIVFTNTADQKWIWKYVKPKSMANISAILVLKPMIFLL